MRQPERIKDFTSFRPNFPNGKTSFILDTLYAIGFGTPLKNSKTNIINKRKIIMKGDEIMNGDEKKDEEPTTWGDTIANAIGAGAVAGFVGYFGIRWGVGALVFFYLLVFPGLIKPFSRRLAAMAIALVVAVLVSDLIPLMGQWAFQK